MKKRKILFIFFITIIVWVSGLDEWIEYYIEVTIYYYKIWGFGYMSLIDILEIYFS